MKMLEKMNAKNTAGGQNKKEAVSMFETASFL